MPLQNRVNPRGELEAVSSRGAFLGNRGITKRHNNTNWFYWLFNLEQ